MSRRAAGVTFCGIAAFLFAVRYIAAAIYAVNVTEWSNAGFARWMDYVGAWPWTLAGVALVVGVGYLVWAESESKSE